MTGSLSCLGIVETTEQKALKIRYQAGSIENKQTQQTTLQYVYQ